MSGTQITDGPIDTNELIAEVMRSSDGALALFAGVVRDHHKGHSVTEILYEAYRPMAEKEMAKIVRTVSDRYPDVRLVAVHRIGLLKVGDASIVIAAASPHRAEAFDACRAVIEEVKKTVPIWKKERGPDGEEWVGWQGS